MPAIPLESELNVGSGGVSVVGWIVPQVVAAVDHRPTVEKLKEANWDVTVNL